MFHVLCESVAVTKRGKTDGFGRTWISPEDQFDLLPGDLIVNIKAGKAYLVVRQQRHLASDGSLVTLLLSTRESTHLKVTRSTS